MKIWKVAEKIRAKLVKNAIGAEKHLELIDDFIGKVLTLHLFDWQLVMENFDDRTMQSKVFNDFMMEYQQFANKLSDDQDHLSFEGEINKDVFINEMKEKKLIFQKFKKKFQDQFGKDFKVLAKYCENLIKLIQHFIDEYSKH